MYLSVVPTSQSTSTWREKKINVNLNNILVGTRPIDYRLYIRVIGGTVSGYIGLDALLISPKETCTVEQTGFSLFVVLFKAVKNRIYFNLQYFKF